MKKDKILVTGCAGFIGSHLCELLLKKDYGIIGIDNINSYYDVTKKYKNLDILKEYPNFSFFKQDIRTTKIILEEKPEIIIHLAGMAGVRYSIENPMEYTDVNINGLINLLEQAVNVKVKKILFASSSSVYGDNISIPFKETDIIDKQKSPYAVSKKSMEDFSRLYNKMYGLNILAFRFFTVYGPRGRPDMAPYKFLNKIKNNIPIDKYGDGSSMRDYTYIDDIIEGLYGAIVNDIPGFEIFNLGNSSPVSLNEFIEKCEEVCGEKAIINQMGMQQGDVEITYADISKSRELLGYDPKVKLEDGLKNVLGKKNEYYEKEKMIKKNMIK
jgi:UDP-glucuronate 4-epimerase